MLSPGERADDAPMSCRMTERDGKAGFGARPLVSVVIPCRNEAQTIRACLESVRAQEAPRGGYEVIVADGLSEDDTSEVLREFVREHEGGLTIRRVDNPGRIVSTGLNAAIRAARGDIIVRVDSHTEYARDYVKRCVECLDATGADNVGGPARTRAESYVQRAVAAAYHSRFAVGGARFHDVNYEGPVDTVTYGCWRKEAFERFGYFDEELVRNQDDEHNLRIVRAGGRVWQSPRIRSWYHPRSTLSGLFRQYMQYGYWKVRVIQKHRLPASWRHLVPGAFVIGVLTLMILSAGLGAASAMVAWGGILRAVNFGVLALLAMTLGSYALALATASVLTARSNSWRLLPVLPAVFACYHLGYGWGFLRGLADFVMLRRRAGAAFTELTRGAGWSARTATGEQTAQGPVTASRA
jgi:glycosyltransferase involved in cell wall biosynthesis